MNAQHNTRNHPPSYFGADAEELEATYEAANPRDRPALLRAFCQIDPANPERKGFCDMLASDHYTRAEIKQMEHFRDGAR